jgi:hypothetical protein
MIKVIKSVNADYDTTLAITNSLEFDGCISLSIRDSGGNVTSFITVQKSKLKEIFGDKNG